MISQGQYAAGGITADEPTNPAFGLRDPTQQVGIWDPETPDNDGRKNGTQPVNEPARRKVGFAGETYALLDFYNRIHIQYTELNLGNLVSNQTRDFSVFNAYFVPRTLNVIVATGTDGLTLVEPSATPLVYNPLQELTYQLQISTDGPPNVDALYTFDFDVIGLDLHVFGSRLLLFPFQPDDGMLEVLEWATEVIESYNGTEQRIRLRGAPRQRFEYEVMTLGNQDTKLRALMFDWMARVFGVPVWFEMRLLGAATSVGATSITVSTLNGDFRDGGLAMVYEDENTYEAAEIESLSSTSITFTSQLGNAYSTKAYVMPVRTAHAVPQINRNLTPTNVARTQVAFITLDNENLASTSSANTHDSKVLLDDANFMDGRIPEGMQRKVTIIDSTTGVYSQVSGVDRSRVSLRKRWQVTTLADLWRVRKLLHAFDGKRVAFFLPSFRDDFELVQDIGPGANTFRIRNCSYTALIKTRRPYGDVRVLLNNGTAYVRKITGSSVDGDDEVISILTAFSAGAISMDDVARVELVHLVRIADDRAKIQHRRAGTAQIEINVTSCKE